MRGFGFLLLAVGTVAVIFFLNMDTSVATSGGYGLPSRVENIGLIAQRQNYLLVSGLVVVVGVLLAIFGGQVSSADSDTTPVLIPAPTPEDRNLTNESYRLWLVNTYKISRNDVLDRFIIEDQTFESLDAALGHAHNSELAMIEAIELEKQTAIQESQRMQAAYDRWREEEHVRWQKNKPRVIGITIASILALLAASPFVYNLVQESQEKVRLRDLAEEKRIINEISEAGIEIMSESTGITFDKVTRDSWCDENSGLLAGYSVPVSVRSVVVFYDGRYNESYSGSDSLDDDYANKNYRMKGGQTFELTVFGDGDSSSVYFCKIVS